MVISAAKGPMAISTTSTTGTMSLTTTNKDITLNAGTADLVISSTMQAATTDLTLKSAASGSIVLDASTGTDNVVTSNIVSAASEALTLTSAAGDLVLAPASGTVDFSGAVLSAVGDPADDNDVAPWGWIKAYADSVASGLSVKPSVAYATLSTDDFSASDLEASGSINNKTLTSTAQVVLPTVDGVTLAVGDEILITSGTGVHAAKNGIWAVTTLGVDASVDWVLTRRDDADGSRYDTTVSGDEQDADLTSQTELKRGTFVFVRSGSVNQKTGWVISSTATCLAGDPTSTNNVDLSTAITGSVGPDRTTWTQFSGSGTFSGGDGISLPTDSTVISVDLRDTDPGLAFATGELYTTAVQAYVSSVGTTVASDLTLTSSTRSLVVNGTASIWGDTPDVGSAPYSYTSAVTPKGLVLLGSLTGLDGTTDTRMSRPIYYNDCDGVTPVAGAWRSLVRKSTATGSNATVFALEYFDGDDWVNKFHVASA